MPDCPCCGKANATESSFCQHCGARLDAAPAASTAGDGGGEATADPRPVCGRCHTVNDEGMSFCRMCGAPLAGARPEAPVLAPPPPGPPAGESEATAPSTLPTMPPPLAASSAPPVAAAPQLCPSCGRPTPAGLAFCQYCGGRLPASGGPRLVTPAAVREAPSLPPSVMPSLRGLTGLPPVGARLDARSSSLPAGRTPASLPPLAPLSPRVAPLTAAAASLEPQRPLAAPSTPPPAEAAAARSSPPPAAAPEPAPRFHDGAEASPGRLVLLREGRNPEVHALSAEAFDVGRSEGEMVIPGDLHLAPRHARFSAAGGVVKVHPLDALNGVYLKLREPHLLAPGDMLIVGRQVLRYEGLGDEEREPPAVVQHGVHLLGSGLKPAWGRLRQITAAGTTRDVWHLAGDEVTVGASGSDVVLGDDDEVLPHHVLLHRSAGQTRIEDTGSSVGGTFLRLRGERELRGGDVLRLGDQLLRFESAS